MSYSLPAYRRPDFNSPPLAGAPAVRFEPAPCDGVAPEGFHATSVFPEYFHLGEGNWSLLRASRMDCVVVRTRGQLQVCEFRHLKKGDRVACGRSENGEEGIFVHDLPFEQAQETEGEKFGFRSTFNRETSFSRPYEELYELLKHDRVHGFILWVLGPAVVFDGDARNAFCGLIEKGFVHGVAAGNALATHDLEADLFRTALGVRIDDGTMSRQGHYHHLDTLNRVRAAGSIDAALRQWPNNRGIISRLVDKKIPFVLAGSIRDDGPMPDVITEMGLAQDRTRALCRRATTVISLATQLHSIAVGNMTPCYQVGDGGEVRPVYFYAVDMSEFAGSKLQSRGSLSARGILANVQDFVVLLERSLSGGGA